jgi:hypothetical protein
VGLESAARLECGALKIKRMESVRAGSTIVCCTYLVELSVRVVQLEVLAEPSA